MTVLALGALIQWLAFIPARLLQTERFYDLTGSLTYIAVTWRHQRRDCALEARNG
jgi:ligand-binding SRPBCC domain-containing protein